MGSQVERVIASNATQRPAIQKLMKKGLPIPSRENTGCYGSPSESKRREGWKKKKMGFEPHHQQKGFHGHWEEKQKRQDEHVRYSKLPCWEKHSLVVSSGCREQKVCSRFSLLLPLWPWASLLTSLCLLICKTGILVLTHCQESKVPVHSSKSDCWPIERALHTFYELGKFVNAWHYLSKEYFSLSWF